MVKFETLTIIVPAYNEGPTIHKILEKLRDVQLIAGIKKEIIIVNDCSKDNTIEKVNEFLSGNPDFSARVLSHEVNQGKGAAIRTGIKSATGDYVIIQDADLEYNPEEFNILIKPILDGFADVVYGSRFIGGKPHRILFFWHSIGNKLLTFASNMFTNLNLTDMETCYKLFKREIIQGVDIEENRFGFEPEVTAKISRIPNIRIYEVGISYYGRTYAEGKKINWKDGFRALYCIIKYGLAKKKFVKHIALIAILISLLGNMFALKQYENKQMMQSDPFSYYGYLPAAIIKQDLKFSFLNTDKESYFNTMWLHVLPDGTRYSKMSIGMAILWLPFFLLGHVYALMSHHVPDGFSPPYMFMLCLSALVYTFIGCVFLGKILRRYFSDKVTGLTLLLIFFGTNLYCYSYQQIGMSHAYTFGLFAVFIHLMLNFFEKPKSSSAIGMGILLGLIIITRPTNIMILIFPVLFGLKNLDDLKTRFSFLIKNSKFILFAAIACAITISPQLMYWKHITGDWIFYSYTDEHFFFTGDNIIDGLFGFRKGWFLYTPIMLFAVASIFIFRKKLADFFLPLLVFTSLNIFVLLSWWCWWYGGSYGARVFIESYALLALPLAALINYLLKLPRLALLPVFILFYFFTYVNRYQTAQFTSTQLHWDSMSKELYKKIFINEKWPDNYDQLLELPDYENAKKGIPERDMKNVPQ